MKEKLERYEDAFKDICNDYKKCSEELSELKSKGLMKSVKFRETLGRKLILSNILLIYEKHGIIKQDEK